MNFDFIAEDKDEVPFLFAQVKIRSVSPEQVERFMSELLTAPSTFEYGMLVDPEKILVQRRDLEGPESTVELQSADILGHYAPNYRELSSPKGTAGILHDYLRVLTEGWLRDVAYHWKSETPPAVERLSRIGLAERLEDGTTRTEASLNGDLVR